MKEGWTTRWKALFIWLSGYLSIIAFAVVGGYAIVKSEDEELKKTAKQALIVTLIFTAISMFLLLYSSIGGMTDGYYLSDANTAHNIMLQITNIAEIIVFATFGAISFFKVKPVKGGTEAEKKAEEKAIEEKAEEKETPEENSRTEE